jgi:hypothetical protein
MTLGILVIAATHGGRCSASSRGVLETDEAGMGESRWEQTIPDNGADPRECELRVACG